MRPSLLTCYSDFKCGSFHLETTNFVQQLKRYLEVKTVIKRIKIEYPESFQTVLDILRNKKMISTQRLSVESKIGGGKLREILDYFIRIGEIEVN